MLRRSTPFVLIAAATGLTALWTLGPPAEAQIEGPAEFRSQAGEVLLSGVVPGGSVGPSHFILVSPDKARRSVTMAKFNPVTGWFGSPTVPSSGLRWSFRVRVAPRSSAYT